MNAVEVNKYIIEEMAAEENGKDITIRLYLSNDDNVEIWFDKENEYILIQISNLLITKNLFFGWCVCFVHQISKYRLELGFPKKSICTYG